MRPLLLACVLALPLAAEPVKIITLGDSITKGGRSGVTAEQTFASLLQATLKQNQIDATVQNIGIGGERTDQALKRLERDVIAPKPDLVTVMYGTNDSWVDNGKTESRLTAEAYEVNLRGIVARLQKAGIQVVLMTEPMFGEEHRKNGAGEEPNLRIARYMDLCRKIAKDKSTPLVDHFGHWAAVQKRKVKLQAWSTDGCHPNPAGHAEMAHRVAQVVLPMAQRLAGAKQSWLPGAPYTVQLDTVTSGDDAKMCWVHPRAGAIPGAKPSVVMTMQKLLLTGSDVFYALNDVRTDDLKTWSTITEHGDTLGRRDEGDGIVVAACDFTPKWHAKSGKLLGVGHTVRYKNNAVIHNRKREASYAVYDDQTRTWSPWTTLKMPDVPKFHNSGAGCVQRVDLDNGEILLPIYFKGEAGKYYRVTVLRCSFDGKELKMLGQGNELELADGRGIYEPSLVRCGDRFYLTLRNDNAGYVSSSDDGLNFTTPKKWTWANGEEIGNYNTQQHWVTHGDDLYLVYNRKGANNDHIIRHRAPLFMAKVDKDKLQVLRETEQLIVPERGARLGNFAITEVSENEIWVTVAEWMQTFSPPLIVPVDNPYGADNSVFAARIRWAR